ncbi:quinone oxidoreductase family protein [Acuticoccus mangrovi]|uniref:Quinone oxidoreductase n=1 Tax=Acuticoccus mangrovi TaxID=2796142 RepID=A0A934IPQ2_9HYPH|nr:quinone oxidoreductase [Acuticoccus mangrovi]MBJ3775329.1 quinone oxidoreductase [Acuticoccus mangrovi]
MRAIHIETYGGIEVMRLRERPVPEPRPGEVLVRNAVSGVNFMDVHTRIGKYARSRTYPVRLPVTLGMEGAGEVVAIGEGVADVAVGDRVAYCLVWGSYADYTAVPVDRLAPIPDGLDAEGAASVLFHGLTAHYLARDVGALGPGKVCLVHAAAGGVGQLLVQMAVGLGARVIATASTPQKRDIALACGAGTALAYRDGEDWAGEVLTLTGGDGVDVVFDPLGAATLREGLRCLRRFGRMVNFGSVTGPVADLDPIELGEAGSLWLTRPRLADHLRSGAEFRSRAADVFGAAMSGALRHTPGTSYRLDDVHRAHEALEARTSVGKPLLLLV